MSEARCSGIGPSSSAAELRKTFGVKKSTRSEKNDRSNNISDQLSNKAVYEETMRDGRYESLVSLIFSMPESSMMLSSR